MDLVGAGTVVAQEAAFSTLESFISIPKTLVQLGYEPVPPIPYTNFLGFSGYLRPNAFKYCGLLFKSHGYEVIFTGFTTRLAERLAYRYAFFQTSQAVDVLLKDARGQNRDEVEEGLSSRVLNTAVAATVSQCTAVIVCHPFRLLGVRLIGQLAGGPQPYTPYGWYNIVQTEGVSGLYSGLGVALLAEATQAVVMSVTTALAFEFVVPLLLGDPKDDGVSDPDEDELSIEQQQNDRFVRQFVAGQIASSMGNPLFYPFQVARSLMLVNGTNLAVAHMTPHFTSTLHCMNYLSLQPSHRGLMRGANIMRRFTWVE
eukprot:m.57939 g.57939  ORF g.57939 m.57939 type:complete len:314 (-) comp7798_c1_seq1:1286-2227(-)